MGGNDMTVYRGSDGGTYTDEDIWERLESDVWDVFCWSDETGLEVVHTKREELLFLQPVR